MFKGFTQLDEDDFKKNKKIRESLCSASSFNSLIKSVQKGKWVKNILRQFSVARKSSETGKLFLMDD